MILAATFMEQLLSRLSTYLHLILTCKTSPFYKWVNRLVEMEIPLSTSYTAMPQDPSCFCCFLLRLEPMDYISVACAAPPTAKANNLGRELISGNSACRVLWTFIGLCDCLLVVLWILAEFELATEVQVPHSWV